MKELSGLELTEEEEVEGGVEGIDCGTRRLVAVKPRLHIRLMHMLLKAQLLLPEWCGSI